MTHVAKADLDKAKDTLFVARNLVGAIQMAAENMQDDHREIIQTLTRLAVEKIDDVTGGILDPPVTEKQIVRARASIEKSGGFRQPC